MKQTNINELFAKMSEKNKENASNTRAGLPSALFEDVMSAATDSPVSGRQPLSRLHRNQLERNLLRQRQVQRTMIEDLELVAEGLAEMNPRSPYRPRQQDLHRRLVSRLAEINELVTSLQLQIERDDEDRSYFLARQEQRREVEEYEKRTNSQRQGMISLKPRPCAPASTSQPRAMTSKQAIAERTQKWPSTQDFATQVKPEIKCIPASPEVIPESPKLALPTPAGSRRSKSRLKRLLSPGVCKSKTTGYPTSSSSGSDDRVYKKLSAKNRKLYKKLTTKIEAEQQKPENNEVKNEDIKDEKPGGFDYNYQWSTGRPADYIRPQQPLLQHQPVQQQQRQPVRRLSDHRWGDLVEDREDFHLGSSLGLPLQQEYPLICPENCLEFTQLGYCQHCYLAISGTAPLICDLNCLEHTISGRCPHSYVSFSGFVPHPPVATPAVENDNQAGSSDIAEPEVKKEEADTNANLEE